MNLIDYWWVISFVIPCTAIIVYLAVRFALDCYGAGIKLWRRERGWAKAAPHYGSVYDASSTAAPRPNVRLVRP